MAAVDSLLRLIASQNAEGMTLATGQVPRLAKGGFMQPLSMPPLAPAMVETFVGELLSDAQRDEVARGAGVTVEHGEFMATVARQGDGWTLSFKRRAFGAVAAPAAPPPTAPPPPPAPAPPSASRPAPPAAATNPGALERWIDRAVDAGATDLIVSAGHGAWMRVAGDLVALDGRIASEELLAALGVAELSAARDLAWTWRGLRFRVNVFRQTLGVAAAFRPVRRDPPTLAELGLPSVLERLVGFPNGLVLVTGPTGSGKSTTLVALIEHLNRTAARHVLTLEDPIEYEYRPARALVHQREVGAHVESFEAGLRAALRESPDVILVGEMRDRATIAAALTAAETGHLVLSTLHAAGAAMAVERVIDAFPEHQQRQVRSQLAGSLRAVLTQHLLRTGAGGLIPAIELMLSTPATAALIRDGKTHQLASAIQTGRDDGMIPLDRSLADRVEARQVSLETAMSVTLDGGAQLRELLGRRR